MICILRVNQLAHLFVELFDLFIAFATCQRCRRRSPLRIHFHTTEHHTPTTIAITKRHTSLNDKNKCHNTRPWPPAHSNTQRDPSQSIYFLISEPITATSTYPNLNRKNIVKGKHVSVRVDRGG